MTKSTGTKICWLFLEPCLSRMVPFCCSFGTLDMLHYLLYTDNLAHTHQLVVREANFWPTFGIKYNRLHEKSYHFKSKSSFWETNFKFGYNFSKSLKYCTGICLVVINIRANIIINRALLFTILVFSALFCGLNP